MIDSSNVAPRYDFWWTIYSISSITSCDCRVVGSMLYNKGESEGGKDDTVSHQHIDA